MIGLAHDRRRGGSLHRGVPGSRRNPFRPGSYQDSVLVQDLYGLLRGLCGCSALLHDDGLQEKLEDCFQKALRELNKHDNMQFDQYFVRKLRAWYTKFPPKQPIRGLGGGGSDDGCKGGSGGDGQGDSDESNEAIL